MKTCGLDFVFIDTEHIALDRVELSWMCQTYAALGLPPLVRIPSPDPTRPRWCWMAATLRYYGRADIPLGSYRPDLPYHRTLKGLQDPSLVARDLAADRFNYGQSRRGRHGYPDAVEVHVQALEALPPGAKAKLIVTGTHSNLRTLLEFRRDVVLERVSEPHFEGGKFFPENEEQDETVWTSGWNLVSAPSDTRYVAEHWLPSIPVYINPDHPGCCGKRWSGFQRRSDRSTCHRHFANSVENTS